MFILKQIVKEVFMERPVIFIDIDGPLMPPRQWYIKTNRLLQQKYKKDFPKRLSDVVKEGVVFDPVAIQMFKLWIKYSNAQIVLSTSWFYRLTKEELLYVFAYNGLFLDLHEDWHTPRRFTQDHRGYEINSWLIQNDHDKFLIVDDDINVEGVNKLVDNWVKVDLSNGLTSKNFQQGCKILGIDVDQVFEDEFGVKKLTPEEKQKQKERDTKMLEMLQYYN